MARYDADPFVTIDEAAAALDVSVEQMLAWNMVVVLSVDDRLQVPRWSVNPEIARYMPTVSEVFQGEALFYCLTHMRPFGDCRNGVQALRGGDWRRVVEVLRDYRLRFDEIMAFDGEDMVRATVPAHAAMVPAVLH